MAKKTRLALGKGATCSAHYNRLHPAPLVKAKYPNARKQDLLTGLVCQRKELKIVNRREQEVAVFLHEDFTSELHVVLKFVRVDQEGEAFPTEPQPPSEEESGRELPEELCRGNREDIHLYRAAGFDVDDDSDPAPENIPDPDTTINTGPMLINGQEWRKEGLCRRRMANNRQFLPTIGTCGTLDMKVLSLFSCFKFFSLTIGSFQCF